MFKSVVYGHTKQREILRRIFLKDRIPHALLFSGVSGIGKRRAAYELINALFCEQNLKSKRQYESCGRCKNCLLLKSMNFPDFREINCMDRSQVNAESIRELLYSLNLNAFLSGRRIVLLDNAENLSLQAANILLKSLEEPRPDTHFILISANPYLLPATLLSRCRIMHFNTLSHFDLLQIIQGNAELKELSLALSAKNISPSDISFLSQGSVENLQSLVAKADEWNKFKHSLISIFSGDLATALSFADLLAKDKEFLRPNIRLLQGLCRTLLSASVSDADFEVWSVTLTNLYIAERLIFERNLSAAYVLKYVFLTLARSDKQAAFTALDDSVNMLSTI